MRRHPGFLVIFLYIAFAPAEGWSTPAPALADEARLARIQRLIESGDLRSARTDVDEALKVLPGDPRLYNFLGVIDAQEKNFANAEANFRRAIQSAPRFTGAYLNLGRLYQEHSNEDEALEKALEIYSKLLQVDPENIEANYQSAFLLNLLRKFARSLQQLDRLPAEARNRAPALALRCANNAALGKAAQAEALGRELQAAGDLTEADVLPIVPTLTKYHKADLAIALLETVVQRNLASPTALSRLATLYDERGRFKDARRTLDKMLEGDAPPSAELLNRLAKAAYQSGDLEGALGYLAHARDLEPANAAIHFLFGLVCIELKLPPEAKKSLVEAVRLDPDNPYYHYALGAVLLQEKNPDEAIPHFLKYRNAHGDDARGNFALGVAYFDAYQLDAARKELESVVNRPETRAGANLYLGRLAIREDNLAEAESRLCNAVQTNPGSPEPYAELALVQVRRAEFALAGSNLAIALKIAPGHYRANLNLLMLYQKTHDPRAEQQARVVADLQRAGEERERLLLRSLDIRPY